MYSKEQLQHLKKLIRFKKLQEDSFNPQWNQVNYNHNTRWYNFERVPQNNLLYMGSRELDHKNLKNSFLASEKTSKLGKQEVSDMVVEASSTFSRNGSVRTSKRSVRSHSRQSSLAGDVSDGHISTSG